ncbi:hypothetical protein L1887_05824 [Cichorium endivia]|nr:hypothetical protein L1887_05824 [Cichorium endivia]
MRSVSRFSRHHVSKNLLHAVEEMIRTDCLNPFTYGTTPFVNNRRKPETLRILSNQSQLSPFLSLILVRKALGEERKDYGSRDGGEKKWLQSPMP